MSNLDIALEYLLKFKFSVVPWKKNKKGSLIDTYKEFQGRLPTEEEVREWWTKWPDAMIGVITGPISDLMALDFDWYKLKETDKAPLKDLVPDSIPGPICISPEGGWHKLFRYPENGTVINSTADILKGFDIRALKGVITMPPSINDKGLAYRWMGGRELASVAVQAVATPILNRILTLINTNTIKRNNIADFGKHNKPYQGITNHNIVLDQGRRDETMFHIANCLTKGGMNKEDIFKTLEIVAEKCNPPFPENEIPAKIESAFNRSVDKDRNITAEIRDYIGITFGSFNHNNVCKSITYHNMGSVRAILHRLCKGEHPIIEPDKSRGDGWFRRVETDEVEIDWKNASEDYLDIKWPFEIEKWFNTAPKNIIIVAGEPDAGKTAFLLNLAGLNNWSSMPIFYFSSEMGDSELKNRLMPFVKPTWKQFRMKVIERSSNFADVIRPDAINIIDFLEIHDEFYKVGLYIKQIFDKLNKGIAVIALQKNPGKEQGLGGMRSIEKARLAINMERGGKLIIDKAKNWATMNNPRGLAIDYKLVGGCNFQVINEGNGTNGWFYADGIRKLGEREAKQQQYQQPYSDQF